MLNAWLGPVGPSSSVLATPVVTTSVEGSAADCQAEPLNGTVMFTPR